MYDIDYRILIITGLCWIAYGIYLLTKSKKADIWNYVDGEVVYSGMTEIEINYSKGLRFDINYKYFVNGQEYIGSNITLHSDMDYPMSKKNQKTLQDMIAKYPVGKVLRIYFNPENPMESFITKGSDIVPTICMVIGAGVILYGIYK